MILTTLLYVLLGLVATLYFGDMIKSSINLNWDDFHWGYRNVDSKDVISVPLWAKILNKAIVIVPALNTLSVFPLIAITLGNNLHVSMNAWVLNMCKCFRGRKSKIRKRRRRTTRETKKKKKKKKSKEGEDEDENPDAALNDWMRSTTFSASSSTKQQEVEVEVEVEEEEEDQDSILDRDIEKLASSSSFVWRLLASIPPVVASAFVRDLSKTLAFSGLPALFVACIGPAMLQWFSSRACMRSLGTDRTRYSWHFSHPAYVYAIWIFSAAVSIVIVMQLAEDLRGS